MSRPRKLPFTATRVLKGVRDEFLSWTLKGLWLEHYALDNGPEGAYLGATGMGERVGLAAGTVEPYRRELRRLGLLEKLNALPGATAGWCPVLPPDCVPSETRLSPDQLVHYVKRLEAHLAATPRHSVPLPRSPSGARAAAPPDHHLPVPGRNQKTTPEQSSGGMEVVGEVGEKPPTSPAPSEVGGSAHAGNGRRLEKKQVPRVSADRERDLDNDPKLRDAMRRWEAKQRARAGEGSEDPSQP